MTCWFPRHRLKRDNCTGEVNERAVVLCFSLGAYSDTAKVVVPAVGPLDHPTPGFAARAAHKARFASTTNVWPHATCTSLPFRVVVVVPVVETKVLWSPRPTRTVDENRVERGAHHPLVVDVGAGQCERDGDAVPIGQNIAFCAEFSAIGGIGTRDVPPFGAFTLALSSDAHSRSRPIFSW